MIVETCKGWQVLSAGQVCLPDKKNCQKAFIRLNLKQADTTFGINLFIPVDHPFTEKYQLVISKNGKRVGLKTGDTTFWASDFDELDEWHPGIIVQGCHGNMGLGAYPLMYFAYKDSKGKLIPLVEWAHAWGLSLKLYGSSYSIAPVNIDGREAIEALIKSLQIILERYDSGQFGKS